MKTTRTLAAILAVLTLTGACTRSVGHDDSAPPTTKKEPSPGGQPVPIDVELISALQTFDECDDLLSYFRTEGAKAVGPYGFGGGGATFRGGVVTLDAATTAVAAPAAGSAASGGARESSNFSADEQSAASAPPSAPADGGDFSATNVQEAGVDEPDLVKTDGKRLVTIAGGQLRFVDVSGAEPRLASTLRLDGDAGYLQGNLLLAGDRVLVLRPAPFTGGGGPSPMPMPVEPGFAPGSGRGVAADMIAPPQGPTRTRVTVVDVADLAAPKVVSELTIDGDLVASRMVGGVARLVLRSGPPNLPFLYPSGSEASVQVATDANKKAVAESTLEQWLPAFVQDGAEARRLTECGDVSRPKEFSGVGMLSVVTVDALDPRPGPAATVVGAGELVYASAEHLYVTTSVFTPCPPNADCVGAASTDIHRFGIADKVRTTYEASGRVAGRLLNQFSMSEHGGDLRVATTDDAVQESAVSVLRQKGDVLEQIGGVGGLGKTERIYAVRFLGDRGYVVTFRQTDPLYVVDLADPTKPVVAGELKIPGYSAYLHPIGDHRLIGIGQDASEQGRVQGTQVSLFDVSDPTSPKQVAKATLPGSQSEAEFDHHAFLWWAKTGLTMVPVQSYQDGSAGAVGFTVSGDSVSELGRVQHRDRVPIRRSIVVGERVLTLSETGLQGSDLSTLAERSWLSLS